MGGNKTGEVPGVPWVPTRPSNVSVIVQRLSRGRILMDEKKEQFGEMNCGLMISVSFTKGAKEDALINCCHFLLTAKLSIAESWRPGLDGGPRRHGYGSDSDSVANICSKGG